MTDHPLRPAKRHSLGEPLPHQQADTTQAPPKAAEAFTPTKVGAYAVLFPLSRGYPSLWGRFQRVTHPSALQLNAVDLHVLYTLPALILSQDQTLR